MLPVVGFISRVRTSLKLKQKTLKQPVTVLAFAVRTVHREK